MGLEEELLVVDAHGAPVPRGPEALDVASARGEGENLEQHDRTEAGGANGTAGQPDAGLVPELKAQQLEFGTRVCAELSEIDAELRHWRSRADAAAGAVGARVAALATSPVAVEPVATPGERYGQMLDVFAQTAHEALTCGCHVHVSVVDDEEGVAVLNRIRIWLPVLTALTANSPFWQGRDTGYASFRSQSWNRWPSAGPNALFADAAEYRRLVADALATGTVIDSAMLYFDARLSEKWPTVEIRTPDVALPVEDAVTLAGLARALVETAARDVRTGTPPSPVRAELLRLAGWRAGRTGLAGDLVHPLTGRPRPAADVLDTMLDHVGPALDDAGDRQRVTDGIAALLRRGTGADLQRQVHRATGDLGAVVRAAVAVTAGEEVPVGTP